MTHETIVNVAVGGHFGVLVFALAGFHKWGFSSSEFKTWKKETYQTLENLKIKISEKLEESLKPVFDGFGRVIKSNILDSGGHYCEKPVNPVGSESYRNALFEFVDNNVDELVDYKLLKRTRKAFGFWTAYLSWSILGLVILEGVILGMVGVIDKLLGYCVPDVIVNWSVLPTGIAVLSCFLALPFSLAYYGKGIRYGEQYGCE
jgi:hypothetical protein